MAADRLWLKKLGYAPLKKTKERSSNFWSSTDLVSMLSLYVLYNSIYIYYKEIMVWSEFTSLCALSFHTLKKQHWPSTTDPISPWPRIEQQTTRIDGPFSFIFLGVTSAYIYMYTYIQMIHLCTSCVYIYIYTNTDISLYISKLFLLILASWSGGGSRCAWRWTGHHQGRWQGDIIQHWDLMAYSSGYADMCIDID